MQQMIKTPNVAWAFYPADKAEIISMLDNFFANVKLENETKGLKAIVAPHAGYVYSGEVAAYSYTALLNHLRAKVSDLSTMTFVILAPSHYEYFEGVSVWLFDRFETPLGMIDTDRELGKGLINQYPDFFSFIPAAFDQEHSYEVQLPFLQYIASKMQGKVIMGKQKERPSAFQILPLIFWQVNPIQVGDILYELSKKRNIFFIVSSDLSHFMEYSNAVKTDEETLQDFIDKDITRIADEADACWIHPWLALTEIAIKAWRKPKLLKYLNSWDTAGDKSRVVGYWSVMYH